MAPPPRRSSPPQATGDSNSASIIRQIIPSRGTLSAIIAIAGGVALASGLGLVLLIPELRGAAYTVMALGGIMLLTSLMMSYAQVWHAITGRRGRYGANTAVMAVAFIGLIVLAQIVVLRNSQRWDLTYTRQFSLAPQTIDILKNLKEPIQAYAFFVPGAADQEQYRIPTENLLNEFRHRSGNMFKYDFYNPDIEPSLAKQYSVAQYPTVVLVNKTKGVQLRLTAPLFQEPDFTSALLIVTGQKRKPVYYLEGHQELNLRDRVADSHLGLGAAADSLARDNYEVILFSLYAEENPYLSTSGEDAVAAVIIAAPKQDLIEKEIKALDDYLKRGGRLLLLLEPNPPQTYKDLLARWAVTTNDGQVIDEINNVAGQTHIPLIRRGQYLDVPPVDSITKPLDQTYFPGTTSFRQSLPDEEMPDTLRVFPLARTTILSCLSRDPELAQCPQGELETQFPAVAAQGYAPLNQEPDPKATQITKIVAFGDADFATNFHHFSLSNSDLLLNSVNWLTEDVSLSLVRPKPIAFRRLDRTVVTGRQMQLIRALSWFALPAGMALLAGVAWWRRR